MHGLIGKDHSISSVTIGSSSLRGRHPKTAIMDDPVNEEDISEATRKRVKRKYNELHKLTPNILIIGQPVHKLDLYGDIRSLVKTLEMPHGTIPELDHDLQAQREAGVSEESISASYFLKVISESQVPFEDIKFIEKFPTEGTSVMFIDPSFRGGDHTALTVMKGYFAGVVVKGKVVKKAWYHAIEDIVKMALECNVASICFETNTIGDQPIITTRDYLKDNEINGIRIVGRDSLGHKHSRILAAGQFAHIIHIARDSDKEYIRQVQHYEYGSEPDDAPDSLATCMEWLGLTKGKQNKSGKRS